MAGLGAIGQPARGATGSAAAKEATAQTLRSQIAAETSRLRTTAGGLRTAQQRLRSLQAEVAGRVADLERIQRQLVAARDRLTGLENRLGRATRLLSANLVATYENSPPDVMSVIVEAHGFDDLLNRLDYLKRVARYDAQVVGDTRTARRAVARQAGDLSTLELRDRHLADAVVAQQTRAAALESALLSQRMATLNRRAAKAGRLHALESQLARLRARTLGSGRVGGLRIDTGGMVQPPAGAPDAVRQVMAAGNAIAGLPYVYGGGHGSFRASAYDCSGSVSYALAAAGLVSAPLTSGEFESWGQPGPGRWITVYANGGHAFMEVAGWRFDTSALRAGGTRWSRGGRDTGGFVARHPPGL